MTTIPLPFVILSTLSVVGAFLYGYWWRDRVDRSLFLNGRYDAARWQLVEKLRCIGSRVTIHEPDDDEGVTVASDWTNWEPRTYRAATIDAALAQAVKDAGL